MGLAGKMKSSNYDKKLLRKKKIIDSLKQREIETMQLQIIKERERYHQIEKERQQLYDQVDKKRTTLIDYLNGLLFILIILVSVLLSSKLFMKFFFQKGNPSNLSDVRGNVDEEDY